jgi:hypothetical protein
MRILAAFLESPLSGSWCRTCGISKPLLPPVRSTVSLDWNNTVQRSLRIYWALLMCDSCKCCLAECKMRKRVACAPTGHDVSNCSVAGG